MNQRCGNVETCVKKFRFTAIQRRVNHQNWTFSRWYEVTWNKSSIPRNFWKFGICEFSHQQISIFESKSTIINFIIWKAEAKLKLIRVYDWIPDQLWTFFCSNIIPKASQHFNSLHLKFHSFCCSKRENPWIFPQLFMVGSSELTLDLLNFPMFIFQKYWYTFDKTEYCKYLTFCWFSRIGRHHQIVSLFSQR